VPVGKVVHVILDNYATHKHPKVLAWLEKHPRWIFQLAALRFALPSASPRPRRRG
jgi:hypothetical protein